MNRIVSIFVLIIVAGSHGEVLFLSDFSEVVDNRTYFEPRSGSFTEAKADPGTFYKSKDGVAFVSDSKTGNWAPPPETIGDSAVRLGFGYEDDFQLRLALPNNWSASSNYTFTVRYRAWPKSGHPSGSELGQLGMCIGVFDNGLEWLAAENNPAVQVGDWTTTTLEVKGMNIGVNDGKQIVLRLQKKALGSADTAVWVDSIQVSAASQSLGLAQ